jgi:predicted nucleotidyltransferase
MQLDDRGAVVARLDRITTDPVLMGGVPCIRRLRIPVATVVDMLAEGMTADEILDDYPDLEPEDIEQALQYSAEHVSRIEVDSEKIEEFARRVGVQELALFGSVIREDFSPDSDVDVLVTFLPGTKVSLFDLVDMTDQLAQILGRPVDLVTKQGLKPLIRQSVIDSSRVIYAAA